MVELYYKWCAPNGQTGYRKGIFKSYKDAWELVARWNDWNGGWVYVICNLPKNAEFDTMYH